MNKENQSAAMRTPVSPTEADETRGKIFATLTTLIELASLKLPQDRTTAIAITKMEEAQLRLMHPALMTEIHKKSVQNGDKEV